MCPNSDERSSYSLDQERKTAAHSVSTHSKSSTTNGTNKESVLEFKNLNFVVKSKDRQQRYILKNITGTVHAGHVVAVLGPSGAGKVRILISHGKRRIGTYLTIQ
jgi:ABC-type transport system involved in cytochrome bd biosynthesis fused ATPase/permease subunit